MTSRRWHRAALAACFGLALVVNLQSVSEDFLYGHKGWCAARRAVAGRNFVRHGFATARFGPVENLTPKAKPEQFKHYWHHPVGIHLLVGASFSVFGVGEWQARLVPILLMLACFLLFADLARRWWPSGPGRWAAMVFFATTPMLAYYGPFVNQEPLVLLACLASVWTCTRALETGRPRWVAASALVAALSAWSDWPWFVFAFWLALMVVASALGVGVGRRRKVGWLVPYCGAVLVGFGAVLWHLSELQGGERFTEALNDLGNFRHSGKGKTLDDVLERQTRRWVDLFTPTLVLAGCAWPVMAAVDGWRRRWTFKHGVALGFLALGACWVWIFKHGAWVHDYWPMFAGVYVVIAGADVVSWLATLTARAARWRPGGPWPRRLVVAVSAGVISLQGAVGLAGTVERVQIADPNSKEGEDFRHRHAVVARWIQAQTDPADVIAVHDVMLKAKFQLAFYLDRKPRRLRLKESTRALRVRPGTAMAVVDLRRAPHNAIQVLQADAVHSHPVTVIEDFLVVDLRRRVQTPEVTWLRLEPGPETWLHTWLASAIYPPEELVRDPWLEADLLRGAGLIEAALARRSGAKAPVTVRQHAAAHNLARLDGEEPPSVEGWLGPLGTALEAPVRLGDKMSLLGYTLRTTHRNGEVIEAVFRVEAEMGPGWRPFFNRHSRAVGEDGRESKMPMVSRVLGASSVWREGDLVVARTYSGLNPWRDRVRYQLGFWRPGTKGRHGVPNQHLRVGKDRGAWIDRADWQSRTPPPWTVSWIPHLTP